ncbi:MAG: hypothetical protein AB7E55_25425 [Pigmentiphaga sp.]
MAAEVRGAAALVSGCAIKLGSRTLLAGGLALAGFALSDPARAAEKEVVAIERPVGSWIASGSPFDQQVERNVGVGISPGTIGWFDFDVSIQRSGWWRLALGEKGAPSLAPAMEVAVDPALRPGPRSPERGDLRAGDWMWLEAGPHRLRLIQNAWTGFSEIYSLSLVAAPEGEAAFRIDPAHQASVFPLGKCNPLTLLVGGNGVKSRLVVSFHDSAGLLDSFELPVDESAAPHHVNIPLPCSKAGDVLTTVEVVGTAGNQRDPNRPRVQWSYSVFDTSPAEPAFLRGPLVDEIDLAKRAPDFDFADTQVKAGVVGTYRETSVIGIKRYVRARDPNSRGWFGYMQRSLLAGRPYLMEVEYPDDAPRVFIAAFQDRSLVPAKRVWSSWTRYPVSIGAETGGRWPNSNSMKTIAAVVWPNTEDTRIIFFNLFDGAKAAISKVRFYALNEAESHPRRLGGRDVIYWYEEGGNFNNLVGLGGVPSATFAAVDRLLRLARASGATVFIPTTLVYGHQLYPSRFQLTFNDQSRDMTAAFLLAAQRYGLKVIPELHPRADELIWTAENEQTLGQRLLLSRDGSTNRFDQKGRRNVPPYYNALNEEVKSWYIGAIQELVENYKDYPAFGGVSLRASIWSNGAFNNFVSLDWGYNSDIIKRFFAESGLSPPDEVSLGDLDDIGAGRLRGLLATRYRANWIAWRCEKIADLYREIVANVRAARPDLKVVLDLSVMAIAGPAPGQEALREAGIDLALLAAIPGLEIVDGRFTFGASRASMKGRQEIEEAAFAPQSFAYAENQNGRASTLFSMQYHEIPGETWPQEKMGFPKPMPREPWVSSPTNPPDPYDRARFARLVAEHDVFAMGFGGNGYVFNQDGTRDVFLEFAALPRVPFDRLANVQLPLIVRVHDDLGYIVNTSDKEVVADVKFVRQTSLLSLMTGQIEIKDGRTALITMAPFSIYSFRTSSPNAIERVFKH